MCTALRTYVSLQIFHIAQSIFCSTEARKLRDKYDELLHLSYSSMSAQLFSKNVITIQEKLEIERLVGRKQMEKVVDIVILSLNSNVTAKYKGFLEAMEENDDFVLQNKAKDLGTYNYVNELVATYITPLVIINCIQYHYCNIQ